MAGIFIQYLQWHYYEMPRNILWGWRNFLEFGLNYFSTPVLVKTLFSPWRRYHYEYPRGFDPGQWFNALTFNLMSRGIGAVVRLFMISIGMVAEILILLAGIFIFLLWLALPLCVVVLFLLGVKLII